MAGKQNAPEAFIEGFNREVTVQRVFTDDEMDAMIQAAENDFANATVGGKKSDPTIRRSQVHWLDRDKYSWAYDKVWHVEQAVNASHYGIDIKNFEGRMQLTR